MDPLEVGIVYRKGHQLFIAVSPTTLITFKQGQVSEIRPHSNYDSVRSISVEALCEHWSITLDDLDSMTSHYLPAPQDTIKPSPRGSRRARQSNELLWRALRSVRVVAP